MMSIIRFIIFLAVIIIAVGTGYYYFSVKQYHEAVKAQTDPILHARVKGNIPNGAMMEDGTLPE